MLDLVASLYVEEVKNKEVLIADIHDMTEKVKAMTRVKAYYIEKVQDFEARASSLELTIVDKDRELYMAS